MAEETGLPILDIAAAVAEVERFIADVVATGTPSAGDVAAAPAHAA